MSRLTKRITVLQKGIENETIDDAGFEKNMQKIEKEMITVTEKLGLDDSISNITDDNVATPRKTMISRLTQAGVGTFKRKNWMGSLNSPKNRIRFNSYRRLFFG